MSNSYESIKGDAGYLALGAGAYYGLSAIFAFFPAFIITLTLQRFFFGIDGTEGTFLGLAGDAEGGAYIFFILSFLIGVFIILVLVAARQYLIVLMLYLITAWPFFYILRHCAFAEDSAIYPLPLDWCFLF